MIKQEKTQFISPLLQQEIDKVIILNTEQEIETILREVLRQKDILFSFDYETTGLKPYAVGHRIVCASFCHMESETYVFESKDIYSSNLIIQIKKLWRRILESKQIKKSAHNFKFEHLWTKNILGYDIQGWYLDTMLAAHILNNEQRTGLKELVKKYFGIEDYNSHIEQFLKSKDGGNGFNRIDECPKQDLLIYCGLDSLFQYRLARMWEKEMIKHPITWQESIICR